MRKFIVVAGMVLLGLIGLGIYHSNNGVGHHNALSPRLQKARQLAKASNACPQDPSPNGYDSSTCGGTAPFGSEVTPNGDVIVNVPGYALGGGGDVAVVIPYKHHHFNLWLIFLVCFAIGSTLELSLSRRRRKSRYGSESWLSS